MGNTPSCCYCPRRGRRSGPREPYYESEVYEVVTGSTVVTGSSPAALEPAEQDLEAGEGSHAQQKISCPEMPKGEAMGNVVCSQERPKPLTKKSNSCPAIIVSDSTITKPALKSTVKGDRVRKLWSNSYLRAVQAGCSQEDSVSLQSPSPLPSTSSLRSSLCLATYEKTLPPVPPHTTSEPFISTMVQSTTGSTQDHYLDSQDHKSEETSQLGLSKSSESLNSSTQPPRETQGEVTPASEAPEPSPKHPALRSEQGTLTIFEAHSEAIPNKKLSPVEMQVDCIQSVSKEEPSFPIKFQSIGVQVEDEWRSSVPSHSTSSQQDTRSDIPDATDFCCKSDERSLQGCTSHPSAISIDGSPEQAPMIAQIKCNLSSRENCNREASSMPASDPWLQTTSRSPAEAAQQGTCRQDGYWFLKLLQAETEWLEGWCCQMDKETKENNLSEDVVGQVLSAVGSAQLLMSQKFQQFQGLCEQNLNPDANPRPTAQDLAGFWDLLQLSIKDIRIKFADLHHLKANSWQLVETPEKRKKEKKPHVPVPKKAGKSKAATSHDKASDARDKQRQEARKRLLAARWAASLWPNTAAQSPDKLQVYFFEAQTRL